MSDDYPEGSVVVCSPTAGFPAHFADDVITTCADCGCEIRHRPHVPAHVTKVCMDCVDKRMAADEARGEPVKTHVTEKTLLDLALFYSKGRKQ